MTFSNSTFSADDDDKPRSRRRAGGTDKRSHKNRPETDGRAERPRRFILDDDLDDLDDLEDLDDLDDDDDDDDELDDFDDDDFEFGDEAVEE